MAVAKLFGKMRRKSALSFEFAKHDARRLLPSFLQGFVTGFAD
jgi:hypothetical protein